MASLFRLPDEALLTPLMQRFPGRDDQIRALASLLYASHHPGAVPCRNLVIHGTEATGKTAVTEQLLPLLAQHAAPAAGEGEADVGNDHRLLYAIVNAAQCITGRHLFERIVGAVADSLARCDGDEAALPPRRCETLAQLAVALSGLLLSRDRPADWKFVLVLDAIDRQREGPPTLMPALARLSEMMPCLTCVFIVTAPPAGFLRTATSPHLRFPPYTKSEFVRILSLNPPPSIYSRRTISCRDDDEAAQEEEDAPGREEEESDDEDGGPAEAVELSSQKETLDLWVRFCAAVYDSLVKSASGTLPSFQHSCNTLWPRFIAPIIARTYTPKEFSKLLIAARVHFQDESLLNPGIISVRPAAARGTSSSSSSSRTTPAVSSGLTTPGAVTIHHHHHASNAHAHADSAAAGLTALLPTAARLLLLCAYLASHNATRHDLTLFSTYFHGRRRRRGGGFAAKGGASRRSKHRKIARKLLGAHAFVLERMMAIFEAVRGEWTGAGAASVGAAGIDGDVGMAMATLASLRLLVKVGTGDVTDRGGKWRINVEWEAIRGIGRSIGVDIEEWLME